MDSGERDGVGTAVEGVVTGRVEFHEPSGTYRTHFDATDRPVTEAVIAAVSEATGANPMELPPIYDAVDPDALRSIFGPPAGGSRPFRGSVTFEYADNVVTVDSHGTIEVDPLGGGSNG